ncbi:DUF7677 family protein [Nonomuraea indica]|uniref:DUF7677 domain-containing protein n=1 Tax=Nonomuraea indica TaxID=1581193 RepID=A0ABW8AG87_9ACTN
MAKLPEEIRSSLRFFAFDLANGTLDMELLEDIDYRPALMDFGSTLEMVFTIYTNVLEIDENGQVDDGYAQYRAAQWIRRYCDHLRDRSPFEEWETQVDRSLECPADLGGFPG